MTYIISPSLQAQAQPVGEIHVDFYDIQYSQVYITSLGAIEETPCMSYPLYPLLTKIIKLSGITQIINGHLQLYYIDLSIN